MERGSTRWRTRPEPHRASVTIGSARSIAGRVVGMVDGEPIVVVLVFGDRETEEVSRELEAKARAELVARGQIRLSRSSGY